MPWLLAAAGGALGGYAVAIALLVPDALTLPAPVHVAIGWSFVAAGAVAMLRRPDNRTGLLMAVTGLVWFGRDFDWFGGEVTRHLDAVAGNLFVALVAHLLVVFPDGRAQTTRQRRLVAAVYLLATAGYLVTLLGTAANIVVDVAAGATVVGILVDLMARWRAASTPARRALAPVLWTGPLVLAVVLAMLALDSGGPWPATWEELLHWAPLAFAAVPVAFLVGLLRTQLHRGVVADLVVELAGHPTPAAVQAALSRALGDPSLELAFWLPAEQRYVDTRGHPVDLGSRPQARTVTVVEDGGRPLAALLHDPSLQDEAGTVQAAAAAAQLALENARLQAELLAHLGEVRASRARIVSAGDAERRRIERDLHDGAQQRLLGIRLSLRLARSRLDGEQAELDELLTEAEAELAGTLEDLRALARGIHPAVLTEEGLAAAVEALARRASVPVTLAAVPDRRLPAPVEAAAYYVAAEALANVAKHAHATAVTVSVTPTEDRLVIDIRDDGTGGARATAGGGLVGLQDRVAALDGTLKVEGQPGAGTRVHAEIPLPR
jgi:signal transduction histidine kinase